MVQRMTAHTNMRQHMTQIEWDRIMEGGGDLEETSKTFEGILSDAVENCRPSKIITSGAKQRKTIVEE